MKKLLLAASAAVLLCACGTQLGDRMASGAAIGGGAGLVAGGVGAIPGAIVGAGVGALNCGITGIPVTEIFSRGTPRSLSRNATSSLATQ
jgi:hypothetical protein